MCAKRCMAGREGRRDGGRAPAFSRIVRGAGILPCWGLVAALAAGCGRPEPPPERPAAVRLELVDHAGLLRRVAAHRGKVVVLDCWSTSCPPCVREFPGLVRLAAAHAGTVACLSLSFDYDGIGTPEEAAGRVREFLASADAGRVENLLSSDEADAMYRQLALDSVPAVYVWRRDGSLARRFDADDARRRLGRPFTYADVEAEVQALLAE